MQELSSGLNVSGGFLKVLFLQRLPVNIRAVLSINSVPKLTEMCTKMIGHIPHVTAVKTNPVAASQELMSLDKLVDQTVAVDVKFGPAGTRSILLVSGQWNESDNGIC